MSVPASTLRKLAALGLSADQMSGVLDILADGIEAEESRKEAQRERTRRAREKQRGNVTVTRQERYGNSDDTRGGVTRVEDKTLNLEIEPQKEERKKRATSALLPAFDEFWSAFPNKAGKRVAFSAYVAATKRADHSEIMAGLRRYVASKPADRPWLNPATFLNQDRWADEPAVVPVARGSPAGHRPNPLADAFGRMAQQMRTQDVHTEPVANVVRYISAASRGN